MRNDNTDRTLTLQQTRAECQPTSDTMTLIGHCFYTHPTSKLGNHKKSLPSANSETFYCMKRLSRLGRDRKEWPASPTPSLV